MDWTVIEASWNHLTEAVQEKKWGKLTEHDVEVIAGRRGKLIGKLQERYGYGKQRVEGEVDHFARLLFDTRKSDLLGTIEDGKPSAGGQSTLLLPTPYLGPDVIAAPDHVVNEFDESRF